MRTLAGLVCWALALALVLSTSTVNGLSLLAVVLIVLGAFILWPESNSTPTGPRR